VITGTIAVCTRNRAVVLARCLASLASQFAEPGQLEVLVVDNGSTDDTPRLLREWAASGDDRRVVDEPQTGLSHARNAALRATNRDVVVFTDDDAVVPTGWAHAHLAAFEDASVGGVGGPIELLWLAGRPPWVSDGLAEWYGALDLGDEPIPWPDDHGPYGVNMSVRREAALAVGGYNPRLGAHGRRLRFGDEPYLTRRLVAAGWQIRYEPTAHVVHCVIADRISRRWAIRRGWAQGVADARLDVLSGSSTRAERLRAAADSAAEARRYWRPPASASADESLLSRARALAHMAKGLELLRLATHPGGAGR
jgi:glycosyltransferase involved in cell wall biosynthesis